MKRVLFVGLLMVLSATSALAQDVCPPAKVNNLSILDTGKTTIILSWSDPGDDCSTGSPTSFEIRRSSSAITESNYYSATVVVSGATPFGGSCYTADGLTCTTTYYFAITFLDEANNRSPVSNSPSGTTTACPNTPDAWCLLPNAGPSTTDLLGCSA